MATRQQRPDVGVGVGDLAGIARRRLWWFAVPSTFGIVVALILSRALPAVYEAESTVAVEPQGIPESIITSTVVASAEDRFNSIKIQILTRDNLSEIIDEFELFPGDERPREDLIAEMRGRITIAPLPPAIYDPRKPVELNSFKIAFRGPSPQQVAVVTNRLTRDFISANLKDRASLAEGTSEFVTSQLNQHRAELADLGQQVTDYKENFQGELPEQLKMNRDLLERARADLASNEANLESARNQVRAIQTQIAEMRMGGASKADNPSVRKFALDLQLNTLLAHGKTERHPDVMLTRAEIEKLSVVIEQRESNPAPAGPDETRLRTEYRNYEVEAAVFAGEVERLKADIAEYEQRIENTPRRAAEINHLEHTYENLNDAIRSLQLKKIEADMGRTIELAQKGERFRIVESAVAPVSPVSPNRPLWFVAGSILGVLSGLALLVLREMGDSSFHSSSDLQISVGLPVLASVPTIELPGEKRRLSLSRLTASTSAVLLMAATAGFGVGSSALPGATPLPELRSGDV